MAFDGGGFPALQFKMNVPIERDDGNEIPGSLDSLTLGQLKQMVSGQPKPRPTQFAMRYEDEDTALDEIEEFYSYVEIHQVAENLRAWQGSFHGGEFVQSIAGLIWLISILEWLKTPASQRKAHVDVLLESLEHRDAEIRFINARRLLYVLQGNRLLREIEQRNQSLM